MLGAGDEGVLMLCTSTIPPSGFMIAIAAFFFGCRTKSPDDDTFDDTMAGGLA
jgi:hypothetical protein